MAGGALMLHLSVHSQHRKKTDMIYEIVAAVLIILVVSATMDYIRTCRVKLAAFASWQKEHFQPASRFSADYNALANVQFWQMLNIIVAGSCSYLLKLFATSSWAIERMPHPWVVAYAPFVGIACILAGVTMAMYYSRREEELSAASDLMSDSIESMEEYYRRRASEYDTSMGYDRPVVIDRLKPVIASMQGRLKDRNVLEIACGPCFWTEHMAQTALSIVATDVNESVLEEARHKQLDWQRISLKVADAYALPDFDRKFEAVFAVDFFCHVPLSKQNMVLERIHSKLAPGGIVIFCDQLPTETSFSGIFDSEGNHIQIRKLSDGSEYEVIKNYPDEDEIHDIFGEYSGLVAVDYFPEANRYTICYQPR
jgi:ubiquinone/menaquinone biosynthesis C-methylase UbiE